MARWLTRSPSSRIAGNSPDNIGSRSRKSLPKRSPATGGQLPNAAKAANCDKSSPEERQAWLPTGRCIRCTTSRRSTRHAGELDERERLGQTAVGSPQTKGRGDQVGDAAADGRSSRSGDAAQDEGKAARVWHLGQTNRGGGRGEAGGGSQEGGDGLHAPNRRHQRCASHPGAHQRRSGDPAC